MREFLRSVICVYQIEKPSLVFTLLSLSLTNLSPFLVFVTLSSRCLCAVQNTTTICTCFFMNGVNALSLSLSLSLVYTQCACLCVCGRRKKTVKRIYWETFSIRKIKFNLIVRLQSRRFCLGIELKVSNLICFIFTHFKHNRHRLFQVGISLLSPKISLFYFNLIRHYKLH